MVRKTRKSTKKVEEVDLEQQLAQQDLEHIQKENIKVLDVVSRNNKTKEDDDDDDDDDVSSSDEEYTASQPGTKKPKKQANQASNFLTQLLSQQPQTGKKQTKAKALPANVDVIVQQNIDLFRRAMEAKQNNQFELVNENIRNLTTIVATHINESNKVSRQVFKSISNLKECVDEVYHHYTNNTDVAELKPRKVQPTKEPTFNPPAGHSYPFYYADRGWTNYHHTDWEQFIPPDSPNPPSSSLSSSTAQVVAAATFPS